MSHQVIESINTKTYEIPDANLVEIFLNHVKFAINLRSVFTENVIHFTLQEEVECMIAI